MPPAIRAINANTEMKDRGLPFVSPPGKWTFIPKMLEITRKGNIMAEKMVKIRITRLMRSVLKT
jgi:hypothetical protein